MAEVVKEVVSVSSVENGVLLIRHDTFWKMVSQWGATSSVRRVPPTG